MFGMNYEEIGSKDKGLILKSSGKIKIQWGNKFIDLIDSDGNINSKALEFIKSISSQEEMSSNGFYFLDGSLYVKVGDNKIQLSSNDSNNFVSYTKELKLTSDLLDLVLKNIGIIYSSKNNDNVYPNEGLVYILSELKLYKSVKGVLYEYNPKYDSINISEDGKITFGDFEINSDNNNFNYKSNCHNFYSENKLIFKMSLNEILALNGGFRVYTYNGKTNLKVDSIIDENGNDILAFLDILDTLAFLNKNNELIVEHENRNITAMEDEYTIQITANCAWYITVNNNNFLIDNKGVGEKNVVLLCPRNTSTENIKITVTIKDIYYNRLVELFPDDSTLLGKHYKVLELTLLGNS